MNRRERFRKAQGYALYYGIGQAERLAAYPAAVVEPAGQTAADRQRLRTAGTLLIAYVSVMEIADHDSDFPLLASGDFIRLPDGRPMRNERFDTCLLDLTSRRWLGLLHRRIGRLLMADGYDGIFLDTIGNVELPELPLPYRHTQIQAAAAFIRQLRSIFPDRVLIQNNGLNELCLHTAADLDAICWENPDALGREARSWTEHTALRLRELGERNGAKTLLLLDRGASYKEDNAQQVRRMAEGCGFLFYEAGADYLEIVT